jgi:hypothetical protein
MPAARPLSYTVEVTDEWDEEYEQLQSYFVLRLNGYEIMRDKASSSATLDDAEAWAATVLGLMFRKVL